MKKLLIISLLLIVGLNGFGQEPELHQAADTSPLFYGSDAETHYVKVKTHFDDCGLRLLEDGKNMYLAVSFTIDSTGVPILPVLLFGNDSIMFESIIKCMESTLKWIPATKDGKNVPCQYNFSFSKKNN